MSGRAVWGLLVLGWRPVWGLGLAPRVPYLLGLAHTLTLTLTLTLTVCPTCSALLSSKVSMSSDISLSRWKSSWYRG